VRAITTTPAYQRIADQIRQAIVDGRLAPGSKLTPASQLAADYGVVPATVREATNLLLREGLLTSHPGSGLFVREQPEIIRMVRSWYQNPGTGSPWRASMAELGRVGDWESESHAETATPAVAQRLGVQTGARVMVTRYLYTLDGAPAFLATSWEPLELTDGTEIMLPEAGPNAGRGVRDRMEIIGHKPTHCREENLARTLTGDEADRLQMHSGIAVLVVERTYYQDALPLETADVVFPPHIRAVYEIAVD
jgi:GntR family transcriptional regulator